MNYAVQRIYGRTLLVTCILEFFRPVTGCYVLLNLVESFHAGTVILRRMHVDIIIYFTYYTTRCANKTGLFGEAVYFNC